MKNIFLIILLFILIGLVLGVPLFFYLSGKNISVLNNSKPKVAATIFPIYDIAKNIAQDKADVILILPVGTSEHTFDPSPSDVAKIEGSDLILKIGVGLDDWIAKIADPKITRVDLSTSVNLLKSTEIDSFGVDPHYWLSIDNSILIANKIKNELVKINPVNQKYYEENLLSYTNELLELQKYIEESLLDEKGKGIITFHEAFSYFGNENGIKILSTIEPFVGKEPTPLYLNKVQDIITLNKVKVLFKEPQLSSELLDSFVNDFGITILTLDPLGGGEESNSYINMMKFNTDQIKKGLQL